MIPTPGSLRSWFGPALQLAYPFSGWVREVANGGGGEAAFEVNGHAGGGGQGGVRRERVVVSGDEIAMRILRKMEYVTHSSYSRLYPFWEGLWEQP